MNSPILVNVMPFFKYLNTFILFYSIFLFLFKHFYLLNLKAANVRNVRADVVVETSRRSEHGAYDSA